MLSFAQNLVTAAVLGVSAVAAIPQYPPYTPTPTATPTPTPAPEPECATLLRNPNLDFSFNQVPIWKEPWVMAQCQGVGECAFTGVEAFEGAPLDFNGGGHVTTEDATSRVGQSFNLCPAEYDYKLLIRSAVVGGDAYAIADGTEITLLVGVGDGAPFRVEPIALTKGKFSDVTIEIPNSKAGGKGFMFWTAKTAETEKIMVDYVNFV